MTVVLGGDLLLAPALIASPAVATVLGLVLVRLTHQAARAGALRTLALVVGHADKSLHRRRAHVKRNGPALAQRRSWPDRDRLLGDLRGRRQQVDRGRESEQQAHLPEHLLEAIRQKFSTRGPPQAAKMIELINDRVDMQANEPESSTQKAAHHEKRQAADRAHCQIR